MNRIAFLGMCLLTSASIGYGATISAGSAQVTVGAQSTLSVSIDTIIDLYASQFDLRFDPAVTSVVGQAEGSFLLGGGSTFFVPGTIDNVAGSVTFIANTLLGAVPGVNGSGTLLTIDFLGIGPGTSTIELANVLLLDSALNTITADIVNGSLTVESSVPEPGTWLLGGIGLAGILTRRPRRR